MLPIVKKNCNLRHNKTCASVELIKPYLHTTSVGKNSTIKLYRQFTTDILSSSCLRLSPKHANRPMKMKIG